MRRVLPLLYLLGTIDVVAQVPDYMPGQFQGSSAVVKQPHVTAELIPETMHLEPGKPFDVILHLHMEDGWFIHWVNPGEAGEPTRVKWTLPPGFTASPVRWPGPDSEIGSTMMDSRYGYGRDIDLVTTLTLPATPAPGAKEAVIVAEASWLAAKRTESAPGEAKLVLSLEWSEGIEPVDKKRTAFFDAARARLAVLNTLWDVEAKYEVRPDWPENRNRILYLRLKAKPGAVIHLPDATQQFYLEQTCFMSLDEELFQTKAGDTDNTEHLGPYDMVIYVPLRKGAAMPATVSGIFSSSTSFVGSADSIYFPEIHVSGTTDPSSGEKPPSSASKPDK